MTPGTIAAANKSVTGTLSIGPITTNIILGGINIPRVPPAVIEPAAKRTSYFDLFIVLADMIPKIVTDAPTIPVAAPKIVATKSTATNKEPLVLARAICTDVNNRSMRFAFSIRIPIKVNRGIATRVCSSILPENWKVIK